MCGILGETNASQSEKPFYPLDYKTIPPPSQEISELRQDIWTRASKGLEGRHFRDVSGFRKLRAWPLLFRFLFFIISFLSDQRNECTNFRTNCGILQVYEYIQQLYSIYHYLKCYFLPTLSDTHCLFYLQQMFSQYETHISLYFTLFYYTL